MRHYCHAAQHAHPQVVLIQGEIGIGKSRILEEMAFQGRMDDALVLMVRCHDQTVPLFEGVRAALDTYPTPSTTDTSAFRSQSPEQIATLLEQNAQQHTYILLLIDQITQLDESSRRMLGRLVTSQQTLFIIGA
ncbi:MAG: ATP-binding protein, partial [Oscillochloris sp.]|nr:ATP-binding protein [Oscillochloris sp.]